MTAKQFDQKIKSICKNYGFTIENKRVNIKTDFGGLYIHVEYIPKIKVASLHSGIMPGDDGQSDKQKAADFFGYPYNKYNGKYNRYSEDPEYIINEFDEYLNNINYSIERNGYQN